MDWVAGVVVATRGCVLLGTSWRIQLLVDAATEVECVDEFFDETDDHGDHGESSGVEVRLMGGRHSACRYPAREVWVEAALNCVGVSL